MTQQRNAAGHPSWLRRSLCMLATAACVMGAGMGADHAFAQQAWPARPVKLIVPAGAGAAPDVVARLLADKLSAQWGQTVVIDNRPGAGGIPGMSAMARSAPDGYTLGFAPAAMATITPLVYKNPQFNLDADLQPVVTVGVGPLLLVTPAGNGVKTLADLARYAKTVGSKANLAAPQPNSLPHLVAEQVNRSGQMGLYTVPYPTGPAAVTALLAGDALLTADGVPGLLPHVRAGKLTALAVTGDKRLPGFEDIPTVSETYPGVDGLGWFCILAPTGTPQAVIEQVNRDVNKAMQAPDLVARLAEMGIYPRPGNVAAARDFFQTQRAAMKRIVADLGLQPQ